MKYCFIILIVSLQINSTCIAQEIVTLSDKDFNQNGALSLSRLEGWLFTQQRVPDWNEPDIDTHTWEKLIPRNLSFKYADNNGLVEGWFRLKFKVDSTLWGQILYLNILPTGAAKTYVNGALYDEAGNPNKNPDIDRASISYFARIDSGWLPKPITLDSAIYTIAVYCTDHDRYFLDRYSFRIMKTGFDITLFKKEFLLRHIKMLGEYNFFQGIWLSSILILSFLFGILLLLNRNEKTLRWIAMLTFFLASSAIIEFFSSSFRGVWLWDIHDLLYYVCIAAAVGLIPITLSQIILNKVNKKLIILTIILAVVYPVLWYFSGSAFMDKVIYSFMGAALLTVAVISFILIVSNRKKLGKAEWSVVWGMIILVLWMLIHTIFINIGFANNAYRLATVAMIYLTLPVSLLIYISIRFSDNIFMLRKNLVEISKLNDEKLRVQEEKQKIILSQNVLLEKKVLERTTDLLVKNKELEIESALEKVRTIAMGMRKPTDMLDVCKTISVQLESLAVKEIRNVQTAIFYEQRGTYMNYEYYAKHDKTFITETVFTNNKIHNEFATKMLKGRGEVFITHIKGDEVKDWIAYQKTTNVFIDKYLETASSLNYYWFSLGPVALGISTYHPLTEEEINLFKRFLKVFELAYQRYLDIEQAEEQAREAQIELALEKVRARTMAMQKSEELKNVIRVVYEQFVHLKINVDHAGFVVDYTPKGDWHFWIADEQDIPSKITHPYFESVWASQFNEAKEKGVDFFATNLNFKEKNKFYNELLSYVPGLPEASKDFYLSCPGLAATTVLFDNVSLYIENFSGTPYSDEDNKILMRFGKVFQQTYTRFLDLQKAEAQNKIIQAENDRKTKELEEARQLQLSLLPRSLPQLPKFDIAVYMKTATEVGGDYYDFNIQENGVLNIGIGDATGHGLQAGTMITLMKGFFTADVAKYSPQKFLEHCNRIIKDIRLGRILMSFSHLRFENNSLLMSSAGMPPVYYHHKKNNRAEEIIIQGLPLGALQSTSYKLVEKKLNGGDTILLLTDGLPEQMNSQKVIFDYSRVLKYFEEIADNSPQEIINRFAEKAEEWMNGQQQTDDITFVVIRVK